MSISQWLCGADVSMHDAPNARRDLGRKKTTEDEGGSGNNPGI